MRRAIFTFLLSGFMMLGAQAQIVITEIMYNSPEGADIEFIEFVNNSANMVDMSGWTVVQGVTHTFPAGVTLMPGAYLVLTGDSVDMATRFGVTAFEWNSGGLSNSGEDITLVDNLGTTIDSVDFEDNSGGWPTVCDGQGPSLILCDVNSDNNDVANWSFSPTPTMVREDDDSARIFASPGAANAACSAEPAYFFNGTYAEFSEGTDSAEVSFILAHTGPMDSARIDLTLDAATSTATVAMDFNYTTITTPISPEGVGGITFVDVKFELLDDAMVEGDETVVFNMGAAPVNGVVPRFLNAGQFVVKILDDDIPLPKYDIGLITADANNDGEADSLGVRCEVQGIVHGIDLQGGSNIQFTIIDSTGGIGLFSTNDFGYTVMEGDEVLIAGEVDEFNGLAQMAPENITLVSTGNATVTPMVVTTLDESTESELVTLECVRLIDTAAWPGPGAGGSTNVSVTNGMDTLTVRIDSDVDLFGTPVPTSTWLNITGIGGQFDGSDPKTSGYQLLPRYMADVVELGVPSAGFATANDTVGEAGASITVGLDLANSNPDTTAITVSLVAANSTATEGTDFSFTDTTFTFSGCGDDTATFDIAITDDADVEGDETIVLAISATTNGAETTTDTVTIVISDDETSSIGGLSADAISLYPNPASNLLVVDATLPMESIQVLDLMGKTVMQLNNPAQKASLSVGNLPAGTYLLRATTQQGTWINKWVKF